MKKEKRVYELWPPKKNKEGGYDSLFVSQGKKTVTFEEIRKYKPPKFSFQYKIEHGKVKCLEIIAQSPAYYEWEEKNEGCPTCKSPLHQRIVKSRKLVANEQWLCMHLWPNEIDDLIALLLEAKDIGFLKKNPK